MQTNQEKLHEQITALSKDWEALDSNLSDLLEQFKAISAEDDFKLVSLRKGLSGLSAENGKLIDREVIADHPLVVTVGEIALNTLAFLGQLFLNVVTVAILGCCRQQCVKK